MRRFAYGLLLVVLLSGMHSLSALEHVPNPNHTPPGTGAGQEEDFFTDLNNHIRNQPKGAGAKVTDVKLCPICGEPLYKHAEDSFVCEPKDRIDPTTGKRITVAHLKFQIVPCPVCSAKFKATPPANANDRNGLDRDLCQHSTGSEDVVSYATVWMCPECGYANYIPLWGKELDGSPISPDTIKRSTEHLKDKTYKLMLVICDLVPKEGQPFPEKLRHFGDYIVQTQIPDWLKYENALYLLDGDDKDRPKVRAPAALLARLYINAAHANRRTVCEEVAIPNMVSDFQVALSKSVARTNYYIQQEAVSIRKARHDSVTDPTRPETDAAVLLEAVRGVLTKAERVVNDTQGKPEAADVSRFNIGDVYALRIREAGFLDRLGRQTEALEAFAKGRAMFNPELGKDITNQELKKLFERQMKLIFAHVDERVAAIKREREMLWQGGYHLMSGLLAEDPSLKADAATYAYLVAELFRRGGAEPEVTLAWFQAAKTLVNRPRKPDPDAHKEEQLQAKYQQLDTWVEEQAALVRGAAKGKKIDPKLEERLGQFMVKLDAAKPVPFATAEAALPDAGVPQKPTIEPVPVAGTVTRDVLLKSYYVALTRYAKDKGENAPTLQALVDEGYMRAADARLNRDGRIICPESGKELLYFNSAKLGEARPLIVPKDPADTLKLALMGDGSVQGPKK